MRQIGILFFVLMITNITQAQTDVFVLVDVSRSVKQEELNNARQALTEVLTGTPLTKAFVSQGNQQDLPKFKLQQGEKIAIAKFGSLHTTLSINPTPLTIQRVDADVSQLINSDLWSPTDGQTYITLAKAKIAEFAKKNNIDKYRLCVISDNIQDDYGKSGTPNYPDDYTRNLAEGYNTSTNPVSEAGYTKLKFDRQSFFTLSFTPAVDVSKYFPPNGPPPIVDPDSAEAVITITSPPEAKKGKEYEVKAETLNISWTCANCPQGIKYTVVAAQYEGGKHRETKKDVTGNSVVFKVPDGKFRVSVTASNYTAASDSTFVSVSAGGFGWLITLAALAAAAGVGYYVWNKKRQHTIDVLSGNKADDIFSKGKRGTGNTSNSDYF